MGAPAAPAAAPATALPTPGAPGALSAAPAFGGVAMGAPAAPAAAPATPGYGAPAEGYFVPGVPYGHPGATS